MIHVTDYTVDILHTNNFETMKHKQYAIIGIGPNIEQEVMDGIASDLKQLIQVGYQFSHSIDIGRGSFGVFEKVVNSSQSPPIEQRKEAIIESTQFPYLIELNGEVKKLKDKLTHIESLYAKCIKINNEYDVANKTLHQQVEQLSKHAYDEKISAKAAYFVGLGTTQNELSETDFEIWWEGFNVSPPK
jgi:hypothetical protein